jgi:transposase
MGRNSWLLATFRKVVRLPLTPLVSCHDGFSIDALVLTFEPTPVGSARMTCTALCTALLPPQAPLYIETMAMTERGMTLDVAVTTPQAHCPTCTQPSTHMHSDYRRTLADLPWATTPVQLHLRVRRFWCATPSCRRQTFTERVSQVVAHYARATTRMTALQTSTGLALGGAAGARHLARQGVSGSRNTLLRRVRSLPTPAAPRPCAIGIDDWAKRKGHTYGTIVVDLDRRCPVDLLEDRTAETVAAWLQAHPEVTIVARDRAEAYASGVTQGAPEAVQIADRWHLVKHLREAVEAELRVRPTLPWSPLPAPGEALPPGALAHPHPPDHGPIYPDTPSGRQADAARQARRTQRLGQYEQACALRQQGLSLAQIARQVGVSPRTLCRWYAAEAFPERQRRTGETSCLDPYIPVLHQQWAAGCRNATHGWRTLRAQGFPGSYAVVYRYVTALRGGQPARSSDAARPAAAPRATPLPSLTARQLSYLFVRRPEQRTPDEQAHVAQIQQHDPTIAQIATLTEAFAQMVRQRTPSALPSWVETVLRSGLPDLKRFATGLHQDAAVRAACELPYSNGQTEGQVTRLKLLKRQMYGRAKFDLLRQRVLHAA